jgi:hypothetical protein
LACVLLVVILDAPGWTGETPDRAAVVRTLQRALAVREARLGTVRAAWTEEYFLSPEYAAQLRAYHKVDVLPASCPVHCRWQWARHEAQWRCDVQRLQPAEPVLSWQRAYDGIQTRETCSPERLPADVLEEGHRWGLSAPPLFLTWQNTPLSEVVARSTNLAVGQERLEGRIYDRLVHRERQGVRWVSLSLGLARERSDTPHRLVWMEMDEETGGGALWWQAGADYEEVVPDLWVPCQVHEEHYALAEGKIRAWLSTRLWTLEAFELNPPLPPSVFRLEAPVFEEEKPPGMPEPGAREATPPPAILQPGPLPEVFAVTP